MLSRAISARYRTEPAAARSVGPSARDSSGKPRTAVKPWPGRMTRPASKLPPMAMVPAASTRPARHSRQRDADHAGAVLAADHQHSQDGDDRLAELDPGEAELGGVHRAGDAGRAFNDGRR